MEAKRMRFNENAHFSQQQQLSQNKILEFRLWQNNQIAECLDDNYINTLLESTREIIHLQRDNNTQQHNRVENEGINEAIYSYGLKKCTFSDNFDDDDSSDNSISDPQPSTSNNSHSSSLEDFAINSAIQTYGLQKKKSDGSGDGGGT